MRVGALGLHIGQVDDVAVVVDEGRRQRHERVFHPKTLGVGMIEHEQHAFVIGHAHAVHQTNGALFGRLRHLHVELVHTRL